MRQIFHMLLVLSFVLLGSQAYGSDDRTDILFQDFDARYLSKHEKWSLQASLALQGYYQGMLDGRWGKASQAALEAFSYQNHEIEPMNLTAVELLADLQKEIKSSGWESVVDSKTGAWFAFPTFGAEPIDYNEGFTSRTNYQSSIIVVTWRGSSERLKLTHQTLEHTAVDKGNNYVVRKRNRWVTSVRTDETFLHYARSDRHGKRWNTVEIIAPARKRNALNTIAASIDYSGAWPWQIPSGGALELYTDLFLEVAAEDLGRTEGAAQDAPRSSGTGFYINKKAQILTNHHVVDKCSSISASGVNLKVIATSEEDDLAVLEPSIDTTLAKHAFFSPKPASLNSDITVAGYPLQDVLGGLNIVRGSITASKGLNGDRSSMQISAPVQQGNSGGPVFDEAGNVVGVVVSKLDALKLAEINGDIPQNVNFAIRAEVAKLFLASNDIDYVVQPSSDAISNTQIAKMAQKVTVFLLCE
ncbi:Trypsin-like peptidase domain-containing protein [Pseudovibrio denitrificans]|uniref:Serine protease n=1 Tax=Pseudovibrio denitrificans TaxID=258256 RepID=A0A1I7CS47_9HYPH|nr:serine protease [Pseudovibrio denitrificans]SFU02189.1 Trypsin-like peptidase domain-containing protein [Pseudovibrio denitrificans]